MDEIERQSEDRAWDTAKMLAEALPYIQVYDRQTVVIKYGGHAMGESAVAKQFAADVVLLKLMGVNPVVVHGGGPQISAMLDKAGVRSRESCAWISGVSNGSISTVGLSAVSKCEKVEPLATTQGEYRRVRPLVSMPASVTGPSAMPPEGAADRNVRPSA